MRDLNATALFPANGEQKKGEKKNRDTDYASRRFFRLAILRKKIDSVD